MKKAVLWFAFLLVGLGITFCASGQIKETMTAHVTEGGTSYLLALNISDHPCPFLLERGSSCVSWVGQLPTIWAVYNTPESTLRHERGHVDGMVHGPWDQFTRCTTVLQGDKTGRYNVGDLLCVTASGESITKR